MQIKDIQGGSRILNFWRTVGRPRICKRRGIYFFTEINPAKYHGEEYFYGQVSQLSHNINEVPLLLQNLKIDTDIKLKFDYFYTIELTL